MILEKETFKKFGYYPKDLSPGSKSFILWKCSNCGKISEARPRVYKKKTSPYCLICSRSSVLKRKRTTLTEATYSPPSIFELCDLYFSSSIINISRNREEYRYVIVKAKGITLPITKTLSIFRFLGLNNTEVNTQDGYKSNIKKYILSLSNKELFILFNYIMSKHRKLSHRTIGDTCGLIGQILEKLNFKYIRKKLNNNCSYLLIKQGSFFIDGRWIHIG